MAWGRCQIVCVKMMMILGECFIHWVCECVGTPLWLHLSRSACYESLGTRLPLTICQWHIICMQYLCSHAWVGMWKWSSSEYMYAHIYYTYVPPAHVKIDANCNAWLCWLDEHQFTAYITKSWDTFSHWPWCIGCWVWTPWIRAFKQFG